MSQCRLEMLRILVKSDIGLNEVEDYNQGLNLKLRSKALRDRGPLANRGVVREAMRQKLQDEVRVCNECTRDRDNDRRKVKSRYGAKSLRSKTIIKNLKSESDIVRTDLRQKYKEKIAHLRQKFAKRKADLMASKPAKYHGYEGAKVFDKIEFDKIETDKIKVSKVGKLDVSEEEESALRLHPKFAILDKIDDEELDFQEELGYAKLRYTLLKEEEEKLDSDDEDDHKMTEEDDQASKELQEEIEAKSRQYYDPEKKLFNYGRKRATDLKETQELHCQGQ